jgi:CheY-like chemotaxis protein
LVSILHNAGYKVRPANNGQLALTAIEKELPDLILLDIMMSNIDGYEVCEHLKANEQTCDIPVIFFSALSEVFDKVNAFNVGGIDYITKPFQEAELLARIKTHLALQNTQKQLAAQNLQLQQEVRERKRAEEAIKNIVIGVSSQCGELRDNFFDLMVKQLAKTLEADYALIGELIEGEIPCIKTISLCVDGKIVENIKYDLAHTPCENVIYNNVCFYTAGVHRIFPQDILLKKMNVEGYVGIPLFDSRNQAFGIMVALYKNPMSEPKFAESILRIFAAQTAIEMERQRAEETLTLKRK